jgi:hypothetical protein
MFISLRLIALVLLLAAIALLANIAPMAGKLPSSPQNDACAEPSRCILYAIEVHFNHITGLLTGLLRGPMPGMPRFLVQLVNGALMGLEC